MSFSNLHFYRFCQRKVHGTGTFKNSNENSALLFLLQNTCIVSSRIESCQQFKIKITFLTLCINALSNELSRTRKKYVYTCKRMKVKI